MPQKRNPYALVVLRGGAGTLIGRATGVLATQRTPSGRTDNLLYAYGEVAGSVELAARLLRLAAAVAESVTFDGERAAHVLRESGAMATDVAEAISLSTGLDYRSAYRDVASRGVEAAAADVPAALDPAAAIATRTVPGGAAPEPMDAMLAGCRDEVARARAWVQHEQDAARARRAGARGARTQVANLRPGPGVVLGDPPTSPRKGTAMLGKTLIALLVLIAIAPAAAAAQELDSRPQRIWTITEERRGQADVVVEEGNRVGGRVDRTHEFGSAAFEFTGPKDGVAEGQITSSASGRTFDVYTQSPTGTQPGLPMGGTSHLDHYQAFVKQEDEGSMELQISGAFVNAIDANGGALLPTECQQGIECVPVDGRIKFMATAYTGDGYLLRVGGVAFITGKQGSWTMNAVTLGSSESPLWDPLQFTMDDDFEGLGSGSHAQLILDEKLEIPVDLSSLEVGDLFAVHVELEANAVDHRGRESMVEAYLRDPRRGSSDLVETTGVQALAEPAFEEPPVASLPVAECPLGADPESGTLQLSDAAYTAYESDGEGPVVLVSRTGGSVGAASATITTSDDSAASGADYTAVSTTIRFEDGDSSPRLVEIPILDDEDPRGAGDLRRLALDANCAPAGDQTVAEVTISDDDAEPVQPESFTIGGTVTGLEGSGLVLSDLGSDVTIDADGPFEFPIPVADGIPYDVRVATQPSGPDQVCSVANGTGTVDGAHVTDVAVDCVTPPPTSGLDPSFDGDGKTSTPATGRGQAVAIQPDGMIVTAGGLADFVLTRHEPDGDLDPTFGGDGIVTTNVSGADEAFDVAIDSQGRIVAVGRSSSPNRDFAVVRYEPDGDLDLSFGGGDGIVTTDFNLAADEAKGVALQADGMIVVAGNAQPGVLFENDFAVVRYEEDGDVDLKVTTDLGSSTDLANAVALDGADRIVVGGQFGQGDNFALVRYEPDGDLDAGFAGGIVISNFGGGEVVQGLKIRPDGRILAAGYTTSRTLTPDYAVAQYLDDGRLDTSFGDAGLATTDVAGSDDFGEDLALAADGSILVTGRGTSTTINDLAIVRYDEAGRLDESFDGDGMLVADFFGKGDIGQDVAVDADGRIVVAGHTLNGFATEFALVHALP